MRTLLAAALGALSLGPAPAASAAAAGSAFDYAFEAIDGAPMPLAAFRGKVLLVVNTASFCGFTQQYRALQALHVRYEARGLVVIGVPSNDFGGQEPDAEAKVKAFCEGAFGVTFPLTRKYAVRGREAHPFYRWAAATLGSINAPWWNFHKYLVGRDGRLVAAVGTRTAPDAATVVAAIEAELAKAAPAPSAAPSGEAR